MRARHFRGICSQNCSRDPIAFAGLLGGAALIASLIAMVLLAAGCSGRNGPVGPGSEPSPADDSRTAAAPASVPTQTTSSSAPAESSYTFAVCGDNRDTGIERGVLGRITESAKTRGARFIVNTGDVTGDGSVEDLRLYRDFIDSAEIPFYTVPGNHDVGRGGVSGAWEQIMGPYYYSFDHGSDHFVILNNADDESGVGEEQMQWYIADLEAHSTNPNTFIFTHIPVADPGLPFGHVTGEKGRAGLESGRRIVAESKRANSKAFFFGHIHAFVQYRLDGVPAYITGGAGAPLNLPEVVGGFYHYLLVTVRGPDISVEVVRV